MFLDNFLIIEKISVFKNGKNSGKFPLKSKDSVWYIIITLTFLKSHGMRRKTRICKICGKSFIPDKYHPYQEVCSSSECQHQRQILNQRNWRLRNPDYFKYKEKKSIWEKRRAQYLEEWRKNHRDYFKTYYQTKRRINNL